MDTGEFTSLNPYQNLEFLNASTPQELLATIKSIRKPVRILAIYSQGTQHFAWIQGDIIKTKIRGKNNG